MPARCTECDEITRQPITDWRIDGKLVRKGQICLRCYTRIQPVMEELVDDEVPATKIRSENDTGDTGDTDEKNKNDDRAHARVGAGR